MGEATKDTAVATHFPCSCLKDEELITLLFKKEKVERLNESFDCTVFPKEDYVLFYVETQGGINAKTRAQKKHGLFRSSAIKEFKKLCVYGKKGMTVEEAFECDGRFSDSLGQFKLSDVTKDKMFTDCNECIDQHCGKIFRICLEIGNKRTSSEAEKVKIGNNSTSKKAEKVAKLKALAQPRSIRVEVVLKKAQTKGGQDEITQIYKQLCDQFPILRKQMLARFPGDTLQTVIEKVDFGKVQQSFSDVYRLEKLLKLGKSVCKLTVGKSVEGTAFVLFNSYILTNAHLFKNFIHNDSLKLDIEIDALFNHENPSPKNNSYYFSVKNTIIDLDRELDYAILELDLCGHEENKVPQGLLKQFSPMPKTGEACIIGHPGGGVKRFDPTCIIEKETREGEINKHLEPHQSNMITLLSIVEVLKKQGIANIITMENPLIHELSTYHTFMYHGSSGSPVFNEECKVFGLHSSGFVYGFQKVESVIEAAHPVLLIFERFVTKLKEKKVTNGDELLRQIEEESKGNKWLKEILAGPEPMDTD